MSEIKEESISENNMKGLEASGLSKSYKSKQVVRSVSMQIKPGEVVGLLGPNGAGKTTSFYMTLGLVQADGGKVSYKGEDITGLSMSERARLGIS